MKRSILLTQSVLTMESLQDAMRIILEVNEHDDEQEKKVVDYEREPIKMTINTYGGTAYGMFALISIMKQSKTPIHTYGYGAIMSAGFGLFAYGHKRFTDENATFMYHGVGYGSWGTLPHHKQEMEQNEKLQKYYDAIFLDNSNMKRSDMQDAVDRQAYLYLSGAEAVKVGVADEIITEALPRKRGN